MASSSSHLITFTPRQTVPSTFNVAIQGAGIGLLVSALQNSLQQHNAGAMGVFTRTGGTIGLFAAMGAAFTFVDSSVANYREKDDALNGVVGGCAAGFIAGLRNRSLPTAMGACAIIGTVIGTYDAAGKSLTGTRGPMTREEREESRLSAFKKRSLADSVNTAQLERRGISVD